MWRLNKVRHKAGRPGESSEEFRLRRREQERALRQARKDRQLVSRRLLLNEEDEEESHVTMDTTSRGQHVVNLFHQLQRGGAEKEAHLKALSKALRDPSDHLSFIKQENAMHLLVGHLTGSDARCRLQAARCLHQLSHSPHANVAPACLPATPYLLTYLSGPSTKFTELCLYTLGNVCPDRNVTEKLLAQGIVPALARCVEAQRHDAAILEAAAFTLSQLLQTEDATHRIFQIVLASSLPSHLLSVLMPELPLGLAPAIECAWCLHYLTCRLMDNRELLAQGALPQCSTLLMSLGAAVAQGNKEEGLELLVCPLLRCVGNLLSCSPSHDPGAPHADVQLAAALCALVQAYLHAQVSVAREAVWVLNNLTAHSIESCSALLTLNLVPGLIKLLPFSNGINTMVLRTLANVGHKKPEFCVQLVDLGLLSALHTTLKMAQEEMVTLSLDVLHMLLLSSSQASEEFVEQGGLSLLGAIQFNGERGMRRRAAYLLENHMVACQQ